MKTVLLFLALSALPLFAQSAPDTNQLYATTPPPLPNGEKVGRFQIITATLDVGGSTERTVFRIDTATGQTWRYQEVSVPVTGNPNMTSITVDGWIPIGEDLATEAQNARANFSKKNDSGSSLSNFLKK